MDLTTTLVQVARLYYEENLSQQEIADRLDVSRSLIAYYLKKARLQGIVRIEVVDPTDDRHMQQAEDLRQRFDLEHVFIVPSSHHSSELTRRAVGGAAAHYLDQNLKNGDVLGVGWGRTVKEVTNMLDPEGRRHIDVVPLLGDSSNTSSYTRINEVVLEAAQAFSGNPFFLLAPLLPGSRALRDALIEDAGATEVVSRWDHLTLACVGLGAVPPVRGQFVVADKEVVDDLIQEKAVGDICFRYFDWDGHQFLNTGFEQRIIGVSVDQLRKTASVVVAEGDEKARPLLGALRTGIVSALFIDETLAQAVLAELD